MANCDTCGVFILPIHKSIWDRNADRFWHKEFRKLKDKELDKRKGIKKFLYKIFGFPSMPFYADGAFCFCSQRHYDEWKKILIKRIKQQSDDALVSGEEQ